MTELGVGGRACNCELIALLSKLHGRHGELESFTDTTSPGSGDRRASESYLGILSRKPIREVSSARRNRRIGVVGLRPAPYEYGYARFQRVSLFAAIHSGMTDAFRHDSAPSRAHIFT